MEQTRTPAGTPSTPSTPSPQLISTSDRPGQMGLPNQQLAPDRVAVNTDNTQQANPADAEQPADPPAPARFNPDRRRAHALLVAIFRQAGLHARAFCL